MLSCSPVPLTQAYTAKIQQWLQQPECQQFKAILLDRAAEFEIEASRNLVAAVSRGNIEALIEDAKEAAANAVIVSRVVDTLNDYTYNADLFYGIHTSIEASEQTPESVTE